jgi:peptide methionine sulfoxide reductase msrA/msrB
MTKIQTATFAGGCFWCMQKAFSKIDGVINAVAGYTGGTKDKPTYEEVCSGGTKHYEAVNVTFDSSKVSFEELLALFWKSIDPTDAGGQFADRGQQYMSAIFYHTESQRKSSEKSKKELEKSSKCEKPIATKIIKFKKFFPAEDYHQDYYKKNPLQYSLYEKGSGRKDYVEGMLSIE